MNRCRIIHRPKHHRPPLPIVAVVCDDTKTAVAYFSELKRLIKSEVTLQIEPKPSESGSPRSVIDAAKRIQSSLLQEQNSSDQTSVWALLDAEADSDSLIAARQAKSDGEAVGIRVALSRPCFELWTLLHLADTGEMFTNCAAVLARLAAEWKRAFGQPFGPKSQATYSKIIDKRMDAVRRAKRHMHDPSWTEIHKLIEEVERMRSSVSPGISS